MFSKLNEYIKNWKTELKRREHERYKREFHSFLIKNNMCSPTDQEKLNQIMLSLKSLDIASNASIRTP